MIRINIVITLFLSALLVALLALSGTFYQLYYLQKKQPKIIASSLQKTAQLIASDIEHWSDKNRRHLLLLSQLPAIQQMDIAQQAPVLTAATHALEWVSVTFVTDETGHAVARSDDKALRDYSDRNYIQQIITGSATGQQLLIGNAKPIPLQCLAVPIQSSQLIGILTQCSVLDIMTRFLSAHDLGDTGMAFLVDEQQRLIAHSHPEKIAARLQDFSTFPLLDTAQTTDEHGVIIFELDGVKTLAVNLPIGNQWRLVVQQEYQVAYADILTIKAVGIYSIVAVCVAILLWLLLLNVRLIQPLKRLTQLAHLFSQGKFSETIQYTNRTDEIGELAKAVERMSVSIRLALRRLKTSKATYSESNPPDDR